MLKISAFVENRCPFRIINFIIFFIDGIFAENKKGPVSNIFYATLKKISLAIFISNYCYCIILIYRTIIIAKSEFFILIKTLPEA